METLSIEKSLHHRFLQKLKIALGRLISLVASRRTRELLDQPTSQPRGVRDKSIMAYLKHRASPRQQSDFLDRLHKDVLQNEEGLLFARNCERRFEEMTRQMQQLELERVLQLGNDFRPARTVEISCSSAPVLNYLTKSIPSIRSAVGIDINTEQIEKSDDRSFRSSPLL